MKKLFVSSMIAAIFTLLPACSSTPQSQAQKEKQRKELNDWHLDRGCRVCGLDRL